jgi:5-methylcytosine-specific restriction endonuclease McrA
MTSSEKTAFRKTKQWKEFRKKILKERNNTCECCGQKGGRLHLHHIRPELYDILIPDNFSVLCGQCHKIVSKLERRKDKNTIPKYFQKFLGAILNGP